MNAMPRSSSLDCRRLPAAAAVALLALGVPATTSMAEDAAPGFYAGKTIKLIVGLPPGGGADAYAGWCSATSGVTFRACRRS